MVRRPLSLISDQSTLLTFGLISLAYITNAKKPNQIYSIYCAITYTIILIQEPVHMLGLFKIILVSLHGPP